MEDFGIWNPILPFNVKQLPGPPHLEGFQLIGVATIVCPSLIGRQQGRQDDCTVHLEFVLQADTLSLPHSSVYPDKSDTCNSVGDLLIDGDCS